MEWKPPLVLGIALLVFVIVPESQGVSARDSPELYSLYYDWLQGKPAGLVTFNVEPILNGELSPASSSLPS